MTVKLLTEHNLEFLRLKGGCTGNSESTLFALKHSEWRGPFKRFGHFGCCRA